MQTKIYEIRTTPDFQPVDFSSETEAKALVEKAGSGRVTTFIRGYDGHHRSCAMQVFENGAWRDVNIFAEISCLTWI